MCVCVCVCVAFVLCVCLFMAIVFICFEEYETILERTQEIDNDRQKKSGRHHERVCLRKSQTAAATNGSGAGGWREERSK